MMHPTHIIFLCIIGAGWILAAIIHIRYRLNWGRWTWESMDIPRRKPHWKVKGDK
jgi:hypothetical protein